MIKKVLFGTAVLLAGIIVVTFIFYSSFRSERLSDLESGSELVQTSGGPIEYAISGNDGPVILFLHGTAGGYDSGFDWPGFRVLAVSRPGYLRTPLRVGRTPEEQAHAYAELLDSLDIESVVVFGASGGGPSAITFAALHPEMTTALLGLFPISQSWRFAHEQPAFSRSDFSLWAAAKASSTSFGRKLLSLFARGPGAEQWIAMGAEMLGEWPPSRRNAGLLNDSTQYEQLDLLSGREITVPTLVIHGTGDTDVPFSQSERLTERIPGSVLHAIEGGTHGMMATHSEGIVQAMAEFLSRVTTPPPGR